MFKKPTIRRLSEGLSIIFGFVLMCGSILAWRQFASDIPLNQSDINTTLGGGLAMVLSLILLRSLTVIPDRHSMQYWLPVICLAFTLLLISITFSRISYSRSLLLFSFVFAVFWSLFHLWLCNRLFNVHLSLLAENHGKLLLEHMPSSWSIIKKPEIKILDTVNALVVDLKNQLSDEWNRFVAEAALRKIPVYDASYLFESLTGRIPLDHFAEARQSGQLGKIDLYTIVKPLFDIMLILISAPLTLPLIAIITICIKCDSTGSVFFISERTGKNGKPFKMIKFRSMENMAANGNNSRQFTSENDSRITRVGKFLRKSRLDELPQLWNVLRGEMSLIGPRPEDELLRERYLREVPFYMYKYMIRPGISGWAQVKQGYTEAENFDLVQKKLEYDFYYIKYLSYWLDLYIFMRTLQTMFFQRRAR